MYTKTSIRLTVEKFVAEIEMRCPYCFEGKMNVAKGEELFYLEGYRTYTIMHKELVPARNVIRGDMIPYVPWGAQQRLGRGVDPNKFTDPILQHRMCQGCFEKFRRFARQSFADVLLKEEKREIFIRPFSMTFPRSMHNRKYQCDCCPNNIPGNTDYLRVGHHGTICATCAEILKGVIGTEFSS